jgi:transposase
LESAKKLTRPRKKDLYDIFCAILYLIKSGCRWRMLPADFPKWGIVRYYYDVWSGERRDGSTLPEEVLKKLAIMVHNDAVRRDKTACAIIDAQSVQNAGTAGEKGYDAGKKVSGIKRHIVVDMMGLPHAPGITVANLTERQGAARMMRQNPENLSEVRKFIVDGSYSGEPFAQAVRDMCGAEVEVVKRNELHRFAVLPKRWVMERSFGWLDKARLLWKNCERKLHNSPRMVILAFIAVLLIKR